MKIRSLLYLTVLLSAFAAKAQFFLDCSCLSTQAVLITNACQGLVPDLCQFTNCYQSTVVPPPQLICSQSPSPGTQVGPGVTTITVTVFTPGAAPQQCAVPFRVNAPPGCSFALLCASNKTVECGSGWIFDPPTWTNECPNPNGTPPNVTVTVLSTVTNGSCPWTITQTWQAVDDCMQVAQCSQTVTMVDTMAPTLHCVCLTNAAALPPPPMVVTNCSGAIPDLCLYAQFCSYDQCGPLKCTQAPPAGTVVGVGVHPFTVTITDCAGNSASCTYNYTVVAPPGGCNPTPPCHSYTNSWNTGAAGGLLPPFTPDPNYQLVSAPPGGCNGPAQVLDPNSLPSPPWVANGPNSQWIGAGPTANCQEGVYHFRLCFYLPCTDGAAILGQWAADDNGAIHLNGQPTGNTIPSAQFPNLPLYGWFPVAITNGFICGTNCLDFYVTNALIGVNPTGLRAELTNIFNDCCCPAPRPIFNVASGVNTSGPIPMGAPDNQFALTCAPPGVTTTTPVATTPHPLWVPNGPNSQWIGPNQFNSAPAGVYCYTMRFVIPCPPGSPIQASLTGQWSADDTGTIFLNGQPTGNTLPNGWAFLNWSPVNITSGFVPGVNTLTFYVTNAGGPIGMRVELMGSASCCDCTNQIANCSCNFVNGTFDTFVPVNGTGGGWTSSGVFAGDGWQASGGNPGATFLLNNVGDPATDPTIAQTLCCLTPGQCYTIRGQRKVQAWFGQTQPSFAVLLDGAPILTLPVPSNPANANWYDFSVSFTATNACQTIGFAAEYAGSDVSYWIDNIRLECCQTNSCIECPPLHQTVFGCPPVMPDFTTNSFSGPGCTPIGPLVVTQNIPPGTPLTPGSVTVVIIRVCDGTGQCRDCDVIVTAQSSGGLPYIRCPNDMVLLTCTNAATAYYAPTAFGNVGPVVCTPPSGTVFPLGTHLVTCTATNQCGGRATCSFNVTVKPQRPRWLCPWIAVGIVAEPLGQAHLSARPNLGSSGQDGVALDNLGSSGQDGVRLSFGPAQKLTFTTVLDFTAPEGTMFDISLPPDPANPNGTPLLTFQRKSGPKGYCVKTSTKLTDDPAARYRHTCIETNGDLHSSITWDAAEAETEVLFNVFFLPGINDAVMTVEIDCITREIAVAFDHCLWTGSATSRKGWDGCIYGNYPRPPKTKARLILTPETPVVSPPITALDLRSTSPHGQVFQDPSITAKGGRKWSDGHVTLMKAYDDGNERGMDFTSFGNGGGVQVDLGHSASFNFKLTKFDSGDVMMPEDLITRTIGPIRGLTNRPPPPFIDTMLLRGTPDGVECSVDFSALDSPTATVQVFNNGMMVAEQTGVLAFLGQPVLTLPEWPNGLGKVGGSVSCRSGTIRPGPIRLPGGGGGLGGGFLPAGGGQIVVGDEFRILAEMPPNTPRPDYYSQFRFEATDGGDWRVTGLQRVLVCPPDALHVTGGASGVLLEWLGANYRLQGAEEVTGQWYDLGATSPVQLPPSHPARFFRLVCD